MKTILYNQRGEEVGTTLLPKEIFDVKINSDLIHQVAVSQMANRRKVIAHTKNRGEVRGGGRKPWRQKGTGRARHGSIRSPLWRGGGVTFGPRKEKIFKKKIPKKMKRKALFMVLSGKLKNNLLIVLDELKLEKAKTNFLVQLFESWKSKIKNFKEGSVLIALPDYDGNIILAARNLSKTETLWARDLNALDILSFKYLVLPKDSIKVIKDTFVKR
ncbi:MAG TPA: 50S ribosomal protein L4 [Candidatus Humimicrobiaceae bacterium]|nr:50S ribosomal protein L4 [Candidatus Humimicrobiaceae bacterium]